MACTSGRCTSAQNPLSIAPTPTVQRRKYRRRRFVRSVSIPARPSKGSANTRPKKFRKKVASNACTSRAANRMHTIMNAKSTVLASISELARTLSESAEFRMGLIGRSGCRAQGFDEIAQEPEHEQCQDDERGVTREGRQRRDSHLVAFFDV